MNGKETALILAGGRGNRMDLFCHLRPKPALPFAGKLRVIDFALSNCIHSSVHNIIPLVDYQRSLMSEYLMEWSAINVGQAKLVILPPQVGSYAGTADAVFQNLDFIKAEAGRRILILAGDHVYKMDYREMLAFHDKVEADVTIGVIKVPTAEAHRFGTMLIDDDKRVKGFVEKSKTPLSRIASMGIYVFNKEILFKRLIVDAKKADSSHDFGYAILPEAVKHDRVFAFEYKGYWQDIGTVEAYYHANMELLESNPRYKLDSNWPVLTENHNLPIPEQSSDGKVINSIVSPGCVIKGCVENSILSPGIYIEEQASVRNSIIMSNVKIGHRSVIDTAILDEGVKLGKYCYIGFGEPRVSNMPNITLIGKDVVIPDRTAVGRTCKIMPKAGLDIFEGAVVPAGTIIRYIPTA